MATILKCKMCGGDIEVSPDMTVGKCLYCGSTMTLPKIDSDKKARVFNRANEYRLNNEFDKAYDAYKSIIEEDEQEAEAYWGMILSEYGVEYVEDPKTGKRIPTCHRTLMQPIRTSANFNLACKYADTESKFMYQDEAEQLDALQKKIISISAKEESYDVFICYKETDENGERTPDSVLAQEIYNELEKAGVRVFFSRITLEGKLGTDYEAYIYGALRSARVMLMVSTSNEHCNAVWVKNEWMRYLHFMEEDKDKVMVPVLKNMSPYELPDELTKFQSQDMGKLGAIQDLIRGVQKVLGKESRNTDNKLLNELLDEKNKREEKENKKEAMRGRPLNLILLLVLLIFSISYDTRCWNNGYVTIATGDKLEQLYPNLYPIAMVLGIVATALLVITMIWSMIKGIRKTYILWMYTISYALFSAFLFIPAWNNLNIENLSKMNMGIFTLFMVLLILLPVKHRPVVHTIASVICVIVFTLILYMVPEVKMVTMDDGENSKVSQIEVDREFRYIYKDASLDSEILGAVYDKQYYNVISTKREGDLTWYEIKTKTGIQGYVSDEKDGNGYGYSSVTGIEK